MNLQNHIIKCHSCNKELGELTLETFVKIKKGRAFINGEWRTKFYCSEECKNKYESQFIVDYVNGKPIYKIDDKYLPYYDCNYYFTNIEDCKMRMQMKVSMSW